MTKAPFPFPRPLFRPRLGVSFALFAVCVGGMAWLRLRVFGEMTITLTYGLPLLMCLWYPDRRLLWSMAAAFMAMSGWKAFALLPEEPHDSTALLWTMQAINILVMALAVHMIVNLVEQLRAQKLRLEESNQELVAREEEISRQNEELQTQTEELAQQNEEIQQQSEEVRQQAEELQAQTEELQSLNSELGKRQILLESLLESLHADAPERELPGRVCRSLLTLCGEHVIAAAVLEKTDDDLHLVAQAGMDEVSRRTWPFRGSFSSVVMGHDRTAFIADLRARPDLQVPPLGGRELRSVLATPLRIDGGPIGVMAVYAGLPREWTRQDFKVLEWVAAQCALILRMRRLQAELIATNSGLEDTVRARTAQLQEMVNELEHFSYTITHDLRAPLRAMHGFAEVLAEEAAPRLDEPGRDYLRRIAVAAARMDRLITDALSFSRVMQTEMPMTPTHPAPLLQGMIDSYPVFQTPRARIRVEGELPPVLANEAGVTQCFSNLLGNAVKFVAKDRVPEVLIRAEPRDGLVRLWFEDNGIGIPSDMQDRVFGMFQRLSKDYEGTGIGLALVKKVAERMGGAVGVDSEPSKGSRFWIDLKAA